MEEVDQKQLDELRSAYRSAVESWIAAIREEESLANPDHSTIAVDSWERANFKEEETRDRAKSARREYEDALRKVLYNF